MGFRVFCDLILGAVVVEFWIGFGADFVKVLGLEFGLFLSSLVAVLQLIFAGI